jgi:hypothetical protein
VKEEELALPRKKNLAGGNLREIPRRRRWRVFRGSEVAAKGGNMLRIHRLSAYNRLSLKFF